jgi:hypothetical protein
MAYRDFKMDDLERKFGIREIGTHIFDPSTIAKIQPSEKLKSDLKEARYITLSTEKAVSERLVSPVLVELKKLNDDFIQIFSGEIIAGDKNLGLNGEIDYIFSKTPETTKPKNPIFCVTESKIGLVETAFPQVTAQMLGIRHFNRNRNQDVETLFGIATDGRNWRILKLDGSNLFIDKTEFLAADLPLLLGALQSIIDFYKNTEGGKTTINN